MRVNNVRIDKTAHLNISGFCMHISDIFENMVIHDVTQVFQWEKNSHVWTLMTDGNLGIAHFLFLIALSLR